MACTKNLRTDLNPSALAGGVWYLRGWHGIPQPLPYMTPFNSVGFNPSGMSPTDIINGVPLVGDNPLIDPSIVTTTPQGIDLDHAGRFYHYDYVIGACTSRVIIEIIPQRCSGGSATFNICNDVADIDLRQTFQDNSTCGTINRHLSLDSQDLSIITDTGSNEVQDGVNGITIVSPGINQHEHLDTTGLSAGTYIYTNTVALLNDFTLDCAGCVEQTSIITINLTEFEYAGDIVFDPYLVVCTDAACSASLLFTLQNFTTQSGNWYYLGVQTGDVANPNIINQNIFMRVGGVLAYNTFIPGQLLLADNGTNTHLATTVYLDQASVNTTYAFEYKVNEGTPCEDIEIVYLRLEQGSEAGTAPSNFLGCYRDFLANELGGNPIYGLWGELGNSPAPETPGSWSMTILGESGFGNTLINSKFTNPVDVSLATYDFSYLDDITAGFVNLRFAYTATVSGEFLCGACAPDVSTWDVYIGAGCTASLTASDNTDYFHVGAAYPCSGCLVDAYDDFLKVTVGTCGYWNVDGSSSAIVDLIVDGNPAATFNPNNTVSNSYNPTLNWSNVPAGSYILEYFVGVQNTGVNCKRSVEVYINVTDPCTGSCINTVVSDNKSRQMTDLQLEDFSFLSAQGGFNFPYGLEFTAQMDLFIADYKTWIEAQGCIVVSTASYYMDIANNLTYLYLDADQGGVGEHKNITINNPNATINFNNPVDCTPCATSVAIVNNTDGTLTAATGGCVTPIYLWSPNGETTQTITMTDAGTYTVDVTCTENGCLATDSFTCNADCGGEFKTFKYRDDWFFKPIGTNPGDVDFTKRVTSFILDGVEYVPGNVSLTDGIIENQSVIVAADGHNYLYKDIVDGLNAIAVPGITFDYAPDDSVFSLPDSGDRNHRYVQITYPACQTFTIVFETFNLGVLTGSHSEILTESDYLIGGTTHSPGDPFNSSASEPNPVMTVATNFYDCT